MDPDSFDYSKIDKLTNLIRDKDNILYRNFAEKTPLAEIRDGEVLIVYRDPWDTETLLEQLFLRDDLIEEGIPFDELMENDNYSENYREALKSWSIRIASRFSGLADRIDEIDLSDGKK
jgi:hypothetical protein